MNAVLIGYRGTGKSTIAQRVGLLRGWTWVDADVEVERLAGKSIAAIFAEYGEAQFRDMESNVLSKLLTRDSAIIASGGGVVLRPENRARLLQAPTIWLTADVDTILARTASDPTSAQRRPNLTSGGGRAEIEQQLVQREPLYRECAKFVVDTVGREPDDIATEIAAYLDSEQQRQASR